MSKPDAAVVAFAGEVKSTTPDMSAPSTDTVYPLGEENYTAFEVKELLIEYAMRSWQGNMMTRNFSDAEFGGMASFDPKELEVVDSGAPLYTGTDLQTAFEHAIRDFKRCRYLSQIFTSRSDQDLIDNVLRLLDADLTQVQACHLLGERASMNQKALYVANYRVKDAVISQVSNTLSEKVRAKCDFKVCLRTLRGGHPGNAQDTTLYFEYITPFAAFLSQLQDATQLSVIPPLNVNEPYRTSRPADYTSLNGTRDEDTKDDRQNVLGIMLPTPPESFTTPSDSASSDPSKRRDADPGYTLADGPWLYRVYVDFKVVSGNIDEGKAVLDRKITDERSYKDMIDQIKIARQRPAVQGKSLIVGVTHSMDNGAIEKWKDYMEEESCAHKRFQQNLIAYDGYQEANTGEPFMDHWSSGIACEKRKASRENWEWEFNQQMKGKNQKEFNAARQRYLGGRYSPKFGQIAFDHWMKDKTFEMREEVKKKMKPIDEQVEYQGKLDAVWDKS